MSVRVVGSDPGAVREVTCRRCAKRLEYTRADETEGSRSVMGRDTEHFRKITCPACGGVVITHTES